jgi:hypothetical protein
MPGYSFDVARGVKIREKSKSASTLEQTKTKDTISELPHSHFQITQPPFDVMQEKFVGYYSAEGMARHKSHRDRDQDSSQLWGPPSLTPPYK